MVGSGDVHKKNNNKYKGNKEAKKTSGDGKRVQRRLLLLCTLFPSACVCRWREMNSKEMALA